MKNKNRYQNILDSYDNDDMINAKVPHGPVTSPLWVEDILIEFYKGGSKLLDIGCGLGNILKLTNEIGYETTGIEINEDLSKHHNELDVIYGDVSNMDLSFIKKFDVIYTYRVLSGENESNELFNKIYNNMKDDATIIYILNHNFNKVEDIHQLTKKFNFSKTSHHQEHAYTILKKSN